mmetsp:Transcript_49500/g.125769  ORF Transcript_49500/g.125769 Transcript_49500/m.125769 type:complete len:271 (-) Transcript_49500:1004-1816(-)
MDEPQAVNIFQGNEELLGDPLEVAESEEGILPVLFVVGGELVQVVPQQLGDDDQVLLVVEVIDHSQAVLFVDVLRIGIDQFQEFDLVERLVDEVLVVLDDFHADHLACLEIQALHRAAEGRRAQVVQDLVAGRDNAVDLNRELLVLLKAGPVPLVDHLEVEAVEHDAVHFDGVERVARRVVVVHRRAAGLSVLPGASERRRTHALRQRCLCRHGHGRGRWHDRRHRSGRHRSGRGDGGGRRASRGCVVGVVVGLDCGLRCFRKCRKMGSI